MIVLVEYQTRCSRNEWLEALAPRVTDVRHHEPNTLGYSAWANTTAPRQVLIAERYTSKQDIQTHINRPAHQALLQRLSRNKMTKRMILPPLHLKPFQCGWWHRPNSVTVTSGSIFTFQTFRFQTQPEQHKYLALMKEHCAYCHNNEPGTLVYTGGVVQEDIVKGDFRNQLRKGDCLWISVYASHQAIHQHHQDPQHCAMMETMKRTITFAEPIPIQEYNSTGLGYMLKPTKMSNRPKNSNVVQPQPPVPLAQSSQPSPSPFPSLPSPPFNPIPFHIHYPPTVLSDLKRRIRQTKWPDQLDHPANANWEYGTELSTVQQFATYWSDVYDWNKEHIKLQQMGPHYTVQMDQRTVHFIHRPCTRPTATNPPALLLCHGWPGSVWEFESVIDSLATDFHVVIPSIPGYGWSEPFHNAHEGHVPNVARVFIALMKALGYDHYVCQGGDWGSIIVQCIARLDPTGCQAIHLNMLPASPSKDMDGSELTPVDIKGLQRAKQFQTYGTGYQKIHQTRPQTLSYGLSDSPIGLLGWILEKARDWSDCQGNVESIYTKDQLLTNVMIYWLTNSINSSMRLYYESQGKMQGTSTELKELSQMYISCPTACAQFPFDIYYGPQAWMEKTCNVQRYTVFDSGGHFAAMEKPDVFVKDVKDFFLTQLGLGTRGGGRRVGETSKL